METGTTTAWPRLEMIARTLSVSFHALLTSFGLGSLMDVVADEFNLTDGQLQKLTDVLKGTSVNEVLAVALALGPTKFVAGPLAIVVDLVFLVLVECWSFIHI